MESSIQEDLGCCRMCVETNPPGVGFGWIYFEDGFYRCPENETHKSVTVAICYDICLGG